MKTRTTNVPLLLVAAAVALPPSTLRAQRAPDEIMDAYRSGSGNVSPMVIDFFCQRRAPRTPEAMDDLADRMVEFALSDPGFVTASRIAYDLSYVGAPRASWDCAPYEGAWDALALLYRETDIGIDALLRLDVQRGIEFGLGLLSDMDPKDGYQKLKLCGLLGHADHAGELSLSPDGTLEFTAAETRGPYDDSGVDGIPSPRTEALAEELMLEGFIQWTGWPWAPCARPGTWGYVSVMAEDGTWLPPDTGWADIQDKRGFYLSPAGDTIRVLKRR